jgi:hypothetical protein
MLYCKLIALLKVYRFVDIQDGELPNDNVRSIQLYRQPALDGDQDKRGPMPYRRKPIAHSSSTMDEPI